MNSQKKFNKKLWRYKTGAKLYTPPMIHNGTVYFGSNDKSFYAVDAKDGSLVWKHDTDGEVRSGAAIDNKLVYFGSGDGFYYALDCQAGSLVWRFETGGETVYDAWDYYLSTPVISDELIYFGSGDKNIYAVNKETGQAVWSYKTGGIVHTQGEIVGGNIYFGSFDGVMYCLDKYTGELNWQFNTVGFKLFPKGEIQSSAAAYNDTIYFGSRDYLLYAINADDGTGEWISRNPSWVIAKPVIEDDVVYYGNSDGPRCFAYNAKNGLKLWDRQILLNVFGSALVHDGEVFFPSFDGKIYVLDKANGKLNYTIESDLADQNFSNIFSPENKIKGSILKKANETGNYGEVYDLFHTLGSVLAAPVIEEDILYFTSTDGSLYAYGR